MKKYNRKLLITISIIVILLMGFIVYQQTSHIKSKICIEDKKCFVIEIADSNEERTLGLSGRQTLNENAGMLFIFEEETIPSFWMKDMKFPIDIIWISSNFEIIGIERDLQPCIDGELCPAFYPSQPVKYVLEINANQSEIYNFTTGNRVKFYD